MKRKNPFRGIACGHQTNQGYGQRFFRHIEGARDHRRSYHQRSWWLAEFRDSSEVPVAFLE